MAKKIAILFVGLFSLIGMGIGCSDSGEAKPSGEDSESSPERVLIEIFSWWTAPGEVEALEALVNVFQNAYPNVEVVNLSTEKGHGEDAREHLMERMANDDPPDTFQLGPRDIQRWVEYNGDTEDNRLESLDFLYEEEGWVEIFPEGVLDVLTYNGSYYAVPLNIHRQNTLFYNKHLVADPPRTLARFFELAEELTADGIVPVALSATDGWTLEIVFLSTMAGSAGIQYHSDFFTGNIDLEDAKNRQALEQAVTDYQQVIGYANDNASEIEWDDAAELLVKGEAAMYIHGDWVRGFYTTLEWEPGVDFDVAPAPGSDGSFIYNVDAFALCQDAPNRKDTINFLRTVGSADAQEAFNVLKGATPVHPDVDISDWDVVATSTFSAFENADILHNVEIYQFATTDGDGEELQLSDQLLSLYNGDLTAEQLVQWIIDVYDDATSHQ